MKDKRLKILAAAGLIVTLAVVLPACSIIGGIFKAGAIVGVIVVVIIIAIIMWILRMFRGRS